VTTTKQDSAATDSSTDATKAADQEQQKAPEKQPEAKKPAQKKAPQKKAPQQKPKTAKTDEAEAEGDIKLEVSTRLDRRIRAGVTVGKTKREVLVTEAQADALEADPYIKVKRL
jgi:hypothetical protein